MRILVTGASGFVGQALCAGLTAAGHGVVAALRAPAPLRGVDRLVAMGDIGPASDWRTALQGVDAVVHLAARVHVMREECADPEAEFRRVNTLGTQTLARAAAQAGVRRFVYLSSIKVNGEATPPDRPFSAAHAAHPQDPYARSKWAAEQALAELARDTGLETVILRPPLVYGPGVKANFLALLRWVDRRLPLPLGRVDNRRSLLYLGNLVDAIRVCLEHPAAAGRTFLVSDGAAIATPELIRAIASALGRPTRLWPLPVSWLEGLGRMLGKAALVERLTASLAVDGSAICRELDWHPPYSLRQGLAETCAWYLGQSAARG